MGQAAVRKRSGGTSLRQQCIQLRGAAYHEAAHAVVAEILRFSVEHISLVSDDSLSSPSNLGDLDDLGDLKVYTDASVQLKAFHGSEFRNFCLSVFSFASIAAEKRLGILTKGAVSGDLYAVLKPLKGLDGKKKSAVISRILNAATVIVNHERVWAAISAVAEAALAQTQRILAGDVVRQIMSEHIPPSLYLTEDDEMAIERGNLSAADWISHFEQ